MLPMFLVADYWHGIPEGWIAGSALTLASGIGWLVKHVTTRSAERAAALQSEAGKQEDTRASVQIRAFDSIEGLIKSLQEEVKRQTAQTDKIEKEYGARLVRLERRNGRMNHFIVKLLDAYLQIKAYVTVLETIVTQAQPSWKCREFPSIELPCFEDDADPPPPGR